MIYLPKDAQDASALATAAGRGRLRSVVPGLYTDDLATPAEEWVEHHLLAVLGSLYPDWYVSHSTAVLGRAHDGVAFISGASTNRKATRFPGIIVKRLRQLPYPETLTVDTGEVSKRTLTGAEELVMVRISSPLQAIFEVLQRDARQPERSLPAAQVTSMIAALPRADRARARQYAERNALTVAYRRYLELAAGAETGPTRRAAAGRDLDVYFYHYRVGQLSALPGGEIRFTYDAEWPFDLSCLPRQEQPSMPAYEGRTLPAFLDNLLPEGWAEARLRTVHKIAKENSWDLLTTTPRYLSNITLRPVTLTSADITLDELSCSLAEALPDGVGVNRVVEDIGHDPDTRDLWLELKRRGATGLSGVQAKLPVHLSLADGVPHLAIGDLSRSSTHILKLPSREYPELVANEWASMELARRIGLDVAAVCQVEFQEESLLKSPALLIERFDIPRNLQEAQRLCMLEEAASLLCLHRAEKYTPSLERVAAALAVELPEDELESFFSHVVFSWLIGNGDLHAKNIAVLHTYSPGNFGAPPLSRGATYTPLYDLVNTRIVIRGDLFALPLNGKQNNLRRKDLMVLARRLGWEALRAREVIDRIAAAIDEHLGDVLAVSGLSEAMRHGYGEVVRANIEGL